MGLGTVEFIPETDRLRAIRETAQAEEKDRMRKEAKQRQTERRVQRLRGARTTLLTDEKEVIVTPRTCNA
jgi:hypothetical protein